MGLASVELGSTYKCKNMKLDVRRSAQHFLVTMFYKSVNWGIRHLDILYTLQNERRSWDWSWDIIQLTPGIAPVEILLFFPTSWRHIKR